MTEKEGRRVFVQNTANILASVATTPLSPATAAGLVSTFQHAIDEAKKVGADVYLPILQECRQLCSLGESAHLSDRQMGEADELLKEILIAIQTSLFSFVLCGNLDADSSKFAVLITRLKQIARSTGPAQSPGSVQNMGSTQNTAALQNAAPPSRPLLPPAPQPEPKRDPKPEAKTQVQQARPAPKAPPQPAAEVPRATDKTTGVAGALPVRELPREITGGAYLGTIARAAEALWPAPETKPTAQELVSATHQSFSIRFHEICRNAGRKLGAEIATETPGSWVEAPLAPKIEAQLLEWLKVQDLSKTTAVANARPVGDLLIMELRLARQFVMVPELLTKQKAVPQARGEFNDCRLDSRGFLIHRRGLPVTISFLEAYEIGCGASRYLIPAADVVRSPEVNPSTLQLITGEHLFASLTESKGTPSREPSGPRPSVVVRWRDRMLKLEVDSVNGPAYHHARPITGAGAFNAAVLGFSRPGRDRPVSLIVDVGSCLEQCARESGEMPLFANKNSVDGDFYLFRSSGRIFAVQAKNVLATGVVPSHARASGVLEMPEGIFRLQEFNKWKGALARRGAAYIVLASARGAIAWAVDRVEGKLPAESTAISSVPDENKLRRHAWVMGQSPLPRGVIPAELGEVVYWVEPDLLIIEKLPEQSAA